MRRAAAPGWRSQRTSAGAGISTRRMSPQAKRARRAMRGREWCSVRPASLSRQGCKRVREGLFSGGVLLCSCWLVPPLRSSPRFDGTPHPGDAFPAVIRCRSTLLLPAAIAVRPSRLPAVSRSSTLAVASASPAAARAAEQPVSPSATRAAGAAIAQAVAVATAAAAVAAAAPARCSRPPALPAGRRPRCLSSRAARSRSIAPAASSSVAVRAVDARPAEGTAGVATSGS